ncbi:hypothetical protein FRB94_011147 [Tulasnella sp. JGI-2019a]|nr:hypothetical protein FRB94_011147 [Tulasnella sp. JGI-2019a]
MYKTLRTSSGLLRLVSGSASRRYARLSSVAARKAVAGLTPAVRRLASSSAALAQKPTQDEDAIEDPDMVEEDLTEGGRTPFAAVEEAMHPLTYKAITQTPFKHVDMSPVQDAVLSLLPQLAEPHKDTDNAEQRQRDLLVRAKTGTGKTLAFLVPAIEARLKTLQAVGDAAVAASGLKGDARAEKQIREKAEYAFARANVGTMIISPTRELATQIANAALKLSKHHGFNVQLFVGGESKSMQMRDWSRGRKDIFVGTPGRIQDMIESVGQVKDALSKVNTLVLDEADTLLDMGFRNDIENITGYLPPTPVRQTLLFSATVSPAIRQIAQTTLDENFGYINCIAEDDSPVHAHIPQHFTTLPSGADQVPHIMRLIAQDQLLHPEFSKIILFCNTTKNTQLFTEVLRSCRTAFPDTRTDVLEIHSKKSQDQRARVSDQFRHKTSGCTVLVTSDVSARGIDYPDVTRVIQVGIPATATQYIHRVGRTGRGKNTEGRGDLVLLPFETGFVKHSLAEVPIKNTTVDDVRDEVNALADQYDANPSAFSRTTAAPAPGPRDYTRRDDRRPMRPAYTGPAFGKNLRERMDSVDAACEKGIANVSPTPVEEACGAMMGFYAGHRAEIRCRASDVVDGVKEWARTAFQTEAPRFSPQFLARIGLKDGVEATPRSFGGRRPSFSGGMGRGEWTSRDSRRPSFGSDSGAPRWASRSDGDAGDRKGGRSGGYDRSARSYGGDRSAARPYGGERGGERSYSGGERSNSRRESRKPAADNGDDFW